MSLLVPCVLRNLDFCGAIYIPANNNEEIVVQCFKNECQQKAGTHGEFKSFEEFFKHFRQIHLGMDNTLSADFNPNADSNNKNLCKSLDYEKNSEVEKFALYTCTSTSTENLFQEQSAIVVKTENIDIESEKTIDMIIEPAMNINNILCGGVEKKAPDPCSISLDNSKTVTDELHNHPMADSNSCKSNNSPDLPGLLDSMATKILNTVNQQHKDLRRQMSEMENTINVKLNFLIEKVQQPFENCEGSIDISKSDDNIEGFPLRELHELENFEQKLRDDSLYKTRVLQKISRIGGFDTSKASRFICKYLFDDDVLSKYSWTGTSTKSSFRIFTEIFNVIFTAVNKTHLDYTENELATFFKEYLKHASTRNNRKLLGPKIKTAGVPF